MHKWDKKWLVLFVGFVFVTVLSFINVYRVSLLNTALYACYDTLETVITDRKDTVMEIDSMIKVLRGPYTGGDQ